MAKRTSRRSCRCGNCVDGRLLFSSLKAKLEAQSDIDDYENEN